MTPRPPRLEDGHTRIANAILDALCLVNLSAYESRIIWHVFRITYGWQKKESETSVSQISRVTGLDRRHVQRALKNLCKKNLVNLGYTGKTVEGKGLIIGFNKYMNTWKVNKSLKTSNTPAPKEAQRPAPKEAQTPAPKEAQRAFFKHRL